MKYSKRKKKLYNVLKLNYIQQLLNAQISYSSLKVLPIALKIETLFLCLQKNK